LEYPINGIGLITGWWLTYPSEKYEFVSWDYEIRNIWQKMFQTTNLTRLAIKVG
jgi:hypothetical protein